MYKFYNANSKGNFVNDCVVRAISLAENKTWNETYKELSRIAEKNGILLDDVNFVEPLLDSRYKRCCFYNTTVKQFVDNHQKGVYLITMPNHITCCIDGCVYDVFDCTNKTMKCAWFVSK